MDDDSGDLPQAAAAPAGDQPGMKYLVAAVYIMGVLLVLCFVGLIAAIVWKAMGGRSEAPAAAQTLDLALPPGTTVQSMALERDRLVLNTGREILIVDTKANRVISRITVAPQ